MAGNNQDVDKKLNTSTKPGGLPPAKGNKTDTDTAKPKGLLDELDSKLDDLFGFDEKEAKEAEEHQIIKSPFDAAKETPIVPKTAIPDKDKAGEIKTLAPAPPAAPKKKEAVSPTSRKTAPAPTASKEATVQKQKEPLPSIKKAQSAPIAKAPTVEKKPQPSPVEKSKPAPTAVSDPKSAKAPVVKPAAMATENSEIKPAGKGVSGQIKQKPIISKTKSDPRSEKSPPTKDSKAKITAKPVGSKKEPKKTGPKQGRKKPALLKLAFGGIILVGGMIALLAFFQTPDPPRQSQPVAAPTVTKIIKPPAMAPESKTTPPAEQSVPQGPESAQLQPDASPAAVSADEKQNVLPANSEINAADEIKDFLQKWKTSWEKSAGEKGDTDAFISFYSDVFSSNGLDKNKWRQDKAEKNKRKAWIRIEVDKTNIVGPVGNGLYEARFTQIYQSSNYADTSDQVLLLKKEASGWKIIGTSPHTPTSSYPYSIHDGSYRARSSAREAVEAYRKMGLEAYWTAADLGEKGTWYRVFIGYFNDQESARRIIAAKALNDVRPEETPYANLIGTYSSGDDLERQRRLVAESGYSPYVIMDDNGRLNLYVGAHATLKTAEKFSAELNTKGILSRAVQR